MRRTATLGGAEVRPDEHYSYRQYKTWPDGERWELIEGSPYAMSPAPRRRHQRIIGKIFAQLEAYFEGKECQAYLSPIDVFLSEAGDELDDTDTVVQPDLLVVCDPSKLVDEGIKGAPDLILEIASPSTAMRDQTEKRDLYERHGVREYWVINPETLEVLVYRLATEGAYGLPIVVDLRKPCETAIFPGLALKVRKEDLR